jgi:hypothetical protein
MKSWTHTKTAVVAGTTMFLLIITIALAGRAVHSARAARYPNLQGAWEGTLEIPQGKVRMTLNLARTNGSYAASADCADYGLKNIPVSKIVYDYPAFHFEMKAFGGGAYDGKLNPRADEMSGQWKQGSATVPLVFRPATNLNSETLSEDAYAPRADSDVQGVWQGTLKAPGGVALRINFKIAERPPGTFQLRMDSLDQGAKDMAASSVNYQDHVLQAEFDSFKGSFEGRVDSEEMAGAFKQAGISLPLTLRRADAAEQAEQEPVKNYYTGRDGLPGHWEGTLNARTAGQFHLLFNIAQLPDGSFSATLASPDQMTNEIPATTVQHTPPNVRIEWNGIGGSFNGTLKNGKLTGTWRQGGASFPLSLNRG